MSIVTDQVRRLDAQIERISLVPVAATAAESTSTEELSHSENVAAVSQFDGLSHTLSSPRFNKLLRIVKAFSPAGASGVPLSPYAIEDLLVRSGLPDDDGGGLIEGEPNSLETEIEWLLVGKVTVAAYGLVLNTFLDEIIPLSDDIWYWDEVLGSYTYSSLYAIQTLPLRWWGWALEVYEESRLRLHRLHPRYGLFLAGKSDGVEGIPGEDGDRMQTSEKSAPAPTLSQRWRGFYRIVQASIKERSLIDVRRRVLSPVALCRAHARAKQERLRKLREMTATGLGILTDEGLGFGIEDAAHSQEWKGVLERSVALMDMVLRNVSTIDIGFSEFEDKVFAGVEQDPELSIHAEGTYAVAQRPVLIARRILELLRTTLPGHMRIAKTIARENGRPSRPVRYWLPTIVLFASSSTILRIVVNRHDDIANWIRDSVVTVRDFWFNWVVEPVRKVIGTIRHDSNTEIAIMSRDSLKADRESLERMVVEFAREHPKLAFGTSNLTEAQVAEIRMRVKEGDVTPVLKAYERDLRKPFVGAVRGDLFRSLLIQVQKTKVDLEVALSGIDSLLKSQELVFGFVGLTPGVLGKFSHGDISIGVFQYLRRVLGDRGGLRRSHGAKRSVRVLRKIDRILSEARPTQNNLLSYKDHGLLLAEVHLLRQLAHGLLPSEIEKEFIEDLEELANLKGIHVQDRALERIRWAYADWLVRMR